MKYLYTRGITSISEQGPSGLSTRVTGMIGEVNKEVTTAHLIESPCVDFSLENDELSNSVTTISEVDRRDGSSRMIPCSLLRHPLFNWYVKSTIYSIMAGRAIIFALMIP